LYRTIALYANAQGFEWILNLNPRAVLGNRLALEADLRYGKSLLTRLLAPRTLPIKPLLVGYRDASDDWMLKG
jgi:hypothetical protein